MRLQNRSENTKKYRESNKEKIAEREKTYRENNKEQIAEKKKEYREENREQIQKKEKEYREKNKERLSEKHACELCGGRYTTASKHTHIKAKKHIQAMQTFHPQSPTEPIES